MAKIYKDDDADISIIRSKKVAIIGYGSQGHAHALNLRDSGVDVRVGLRKESASCVKAEQQGLRVMETEKAAEEGEIIVMLVPDTDAPSIYEHQIKMLMAPGKTLVFAHGFNIHYKTIAPPDTIDVIMAAPSGVGPMVRRLYQEGSGVPCLVAVHQDASGNALNLALSYAKALGCTRAGVISTTFQEETETDLFSEQVVLCGGLTELIKKAFETLVEAGYQHEIAYFSCLHEVKFIADLLHTQGITGMNEKISDTAEFGEYCTSKRIITQAAKEEMKKVLHEIQNGTFAESLLREYKAGMPNLLKKRHELSHHMIEEIGRKLRN